MYSWYYYLYHWRHQQMTNWHFWVKSLSRRSENNYTLPHSHLWLWLVAYCVILLMPGHLLLKYSAKKLHNLRQEFSISLCPNSVKNWRKMTQYATSHKWKWGGNIHYLDWAERTYTTLCIKYLPAGFLTRLLQARGKKKYDNQFFTHTKLLCCLITRACYYPSFQTN